MQSHAPATSALALLYQAAVVAHLCCVFLCCWAGSLWLCVQALLHDELQNDSAGTVRIILPHGQVGAVMGKRGATIK
jgi:hypothetical protein